MSLGPAMFPLPVRVKRDQCRSFVSGTVGDDGRGKMAPLNLTSTALQICSVPALTAWSGGFVTGQAADAVLVVGAETSRSSL